MLLTVHGELMDGSAEDIADLLSSAGECDVSATARGVNDMESAGSEPVGNFGEVGGRESEAIGELSWGEPLVKIWRRGILLLREQSIEVGLLLGGTLKEECG